MTRIERNRIGPDHRVGSPISFRDPFLWTEPSKCLFITLVLLGPSLWYLIDWHYVRSHPEVAPYLDTEFLGTALRYHTAALLVWAALAAWALAAKRFRWNPPALGWATQTLAVGHVLITAYFFGFFTSLFFGLMLIAMFTIGLLLWDKKPILVQSTIMFLATVGLGAAERLGHIPYAPLLREAPYQAGQLHPAYLLNTGLVSAAILFTILAVVYFVIERWRDREAALASARDQLASANEIIRRYVPSQLAERILEGSYAANARPERCKLTLFFSDIVGFTRVADQMEAEDLAALLNEYLSEMVSVAEGFGATVNQFEGDGIMAFFGAPEATDERDHALRCVRMSIAMQERMTELRESWLSDGIAHPFEIRIGINTGMASVGDFGSPGRTTYTAIGRQTNLTARVQDACEPGKVLLTHSTWELVRGEIPCKERGEIRVKGIAGTVRVYEVEAHAS